LCSGVLSPPLRGGSRRRPLTCAPVCAAGGGVSRCPGPGLGRCGKQRLRGPCPARGGKDAPRESGSYAGRRKVRVAGGQRKMSVLISMFHHTVLMRQAFAHEAILVLEPDADQRAPGAAVTAALCGQWDHVSPCPLAPHHVHADRFQNELHVRVLFATEPEAEREVRCRIDRSLAGQWEFPVGFATPWRLVIAGRPRCYQKRWIMPNAWLAVDAATWCRTGRRRQSRYCRALSRQFRTSRPVRLALTRCRAGDPAPVPTSGAAPGSTGSRRLAGRTRPGDRRPNQPGRLPRFVSSVGGVNLPRH
jgi:hypothetical protein